MTPLDATGYWQIRPGTQLVKEESTSGLPGCPYCGAYHTTYCPRIKAIEYHPNGAVKRVELRD